jgi:thiamine biosynthesis lipoprotein
VPATVLRDQFRGMGSKVVVEITDGSPGHLSLARDRLAFLEARWSRFHPQSDLSRLNHAQGEPVVVDDCTVELLEAMVHGFTLTDGSFDPTMLAPIVRLGYAASVHDPAAVTELPVGVQRRGQIRGLVVDLNEMSVRLPPGTAVDAGGIGKGLAADMVAGVLMANGVGGAMVDVGGDVRVMGEGPFGGRWRVALDAAFEPEQAAMHVLLTRGALGSSGALRRSWVNEDGQSAHHLLDPDSVQPTPSGFESPVHATVLADTAVEAEMHATMAIVRGASSALPRLQSDGLGARVVYGSGRAYSNAAWESVVTTDPEE